MLRFHRAWFAFTLLLPLWASEAWAPMHWVPPYDEMTRQSDLVLIATPVARHELSHPAALPGWTHGGQPIPAVEIETIFRTVVTFKANPGFSDSTLAFVHYRKVPSTYKGPSIGAKPKLVDFAPLDKSQYLMFLKERDDGRFEALNRADPGHCVEKLALEFWGHPALR